MHCTIFQNFAANKLHMNLYSTALHCIDRPLKASKKTLRITDTNSLNTNSPIKTEAPETKIDKSALDKIILN